MKMSSRLPDSLQGTGSSLRFLAAGCLIALLAAGCHKEEKKAAPSAPPTVMVTEVIPRDVPVSFEYVAQTQSSQQVNIQARVNGFLDKRVYTEGTMVKEGDVLFLMDKKPFQAQLDGASAALSRQKAAMETARLNLERTKPLAAQNALSQKDLDDANGNYESSAAAVEQAKSQLETAKLNLSYCTISSPVTGITSAAQQQNGSYINQSNSLLTTVAVLSPMWVNFSISENEMAKFVDQVERKLLIPPPHDNYEIDIIMVDGRLFPHKGRITFASPAYDAKTSTFLIRTNVENPGGFLRPNQYVRVRMKGAIRPRAILVPQRAVQQGAKGHFVWVVNKEAKADYRPVVVGEWHGDDWFITEGLRAGEQVVVDGGLTLRPGEPVTAKPLAAAAATVPGGAEPQSAPAQKRN
jgi:membrane fusion protein (multidrug efflux system)